MHALLPTLVTRPMPQRFMLLCLQVEALEAAEVIAQQALVRAPLVD